LKNDNYKAVHHNRFDITLAVNTSKIMLIILFYVTSRISKLYKISSTTRQNNKLNPASMLCDKGNSSKKKSAAGGMPKEI